MRIGVWAAAVLLLSSTAAGAADWWWIGLNGNAPNRVLVNEAGQVVGIVNSTAGVEDFARAEGATPQSINWAIKADYALPLLPPQPPAPPRTRAQAIALTHDAVCFVIAVHGGE